MTTMPTTGMKEIKTWVNNGEYEKLKKIAEFLYYRQEIPRPTMYAFNKYCLRQFIGIMEGRGVV